MIQSFNKPLLRQYAIVIAVKLSLLGVGLDLGWTSPVLVKLRNATTTPLSRPITEEEGSWLVSIGYLASILTLPVVGYMLDYMGRKYSLIVICFPKIVAGLLTIFATEIWILYLARSLTGVTNTAAMLAITVYCSEVASKEIRGGLGSIFAIFCNLGVLIMLGIGPYVSYTTLSIMFTAVITGTYLPLLFLPDTPFSLYSRGKIEEAERVLIYLRGSESLAEEELKEFSNIETDKPINKRELFKDKGHIKGIFIAVVLGICIQFVGFNCLSFYLQTLLELTHTSLSPELGSLIIGLIQLSSSTVTCTVSDKFGRKPIIITTSLGMALGMIGLGTFFVVEQSGKEINGFLNYLPLISIGVVTYCYNGGIGSQFFVLVTEVLNGPIRAIGMSVCWLVTTLAVFILTRYTMAIINGIGPPATFYTFAIICVFQSMFVLFVVPETKKKSMTEIQRELRGDKPLEPKDKE